MPRPPLARWADWWLRDRGTGRLVLWQAPNPALAVALLANAAAWLDLLLSRTTELRWVATGAWLVWSLDEAVRGVNPARRLLGIVVLTGTLTGALTR